MKSSSADIKKEILLRILDFSLNLDQYRNSENPISNKQIQEMLAISIEINNLINLLKLDPSKIPSVITRPSINSGSDYKQISRALELALKYRSDINAISIDMGIRISEANALLQIGIDYIFANLRNMNFTNDAKQVAPDASINKIATQTSTPKSKKVYRTKSNGGVGMFASLIFLVLIAWGGMTIYSIFMNRSATQLTTLIQEYRSDQNLSDIAVVSDSKLINLEGSSALVSVINKLEPSFKSIYTAYDIKSKRSHSTDAINKLIAGDIDIAAVSRIPSIEERKKSRAKGRLIADHKIALDSVVVFTNKASSTKALSIENIKEIFTSNSSSFDRFSTSPNSGTFAYFKDRVLLHQEINDDVIKLYDTKHLIDMVKSNKNAIAFASLSDVINEDVKILPLYTVFDSRPASPVTNDGLININSIKRGEYPLTRYVYLLTAGDITDKSAKLIDYLRREQGQRLISESGLVNI